MSLELKNNPICNICESEMVFGTVHGYMEKSLTWSTDKVKGWMFNEHFGVDSYLCTECGKIQLCLNEYTLEKIRNDLTK